MGDVVAFVAGEILVLIAFFVIKSVIVKAFTSVNKNDSWIWIARRKCRGGEHTDNHHKGEQEAPQPCKFCFYFQNNSSFFLSGILPGDLTV